MYLVTSSCCGRVYRCIPSWIIPQGILRTFPKRFQVADVSEAVRQRADALMLSGESAMGLFPEKALSVLRSVSLRIERDCREEKRHQSMWLPEISKALNERISEQISISAAQMGRNA